jgi:hypothetical protein
MWELLYNIIKNLKSKLKMETSENTSDINQNVKNYLNDYIKMENPQYAVMITGKWGCGKTFFVKDELETWINRDKISDDELKRNPIYISVYGISNIKQLVQKIKEKISPLLYSKSAEILKKIGAGIIKTAIKVDFNSNDEGTYSLQSELDLISIFKSNDANIKGKKVFIFDDLERSEIPLNQLFGFINEFVEHHQCKVILVCDEEKLIDQNLAKSIKDNQEEEKEEKTPYRLAYKDFKEKLVGQTLSIEADYELAVATFIDKKADKQKIFFNENIELILKIFKASKTDNLRILRQFFSDFERFIQPIDNEYGRDKEINSLKVPVMVNFLILYLEYKSGNDKVEELSSYIGVIATGFDFSLIDRKVPDYEINFDTNYGQIIRNFNLNLTTIIPDYLIFSDFINKAKNDYLDSEVTKLVEEVLNNKKDEIPSWRKLYKWDKLDNTEFTSLLDLEFKKFVEEQIDNIGVLTHLFYIFHNLKKHQIFDKENDINTSYIKNIEIILNNSNDFEPQIKEFAFNLNYQNRDLEIDNIKDVEGVIRKVNKLISKHEFKIVQKKIIEIVESLCDGNIDKLEEDLQTRRAFGSKVYWSYNIFDGVNLDKLYNKFFLIGIDSQLNFLEMLKHKRYKSAEYIGTEKEFLQNFNFKLIERLEKVKLVEKVRLKRYVDIIKEIISIKK